MDAKLTGTKLQIANDLCEQGRPINAEEAFGHLNDLTQKAPDAFIGLGMIKRSQGDRNASLAAFQAAAELQPSHIGVRLEIANELRELGRLAESDAVLNRVLAQHPNNMGAQIGLGHLKRSQGDRLGSLAAFKVAAHIDPNHFGVQLEIANDLREIDRLNEAEAVLQDLIKQQPANSGALICLGHLRRRQGDRRAALAAFEKAAVTEPNHMGIQLEIASDLRELGRLGDAETVLNQVIAQQPGSVTALIGLGHLKRRQNTRLASLAAFEAAAAIEPGHIGIQLEMANDLRELGRLDDAEAHLRRLLLHHPNDPGAIIGLAQVKRRQGDRIASLLAFETAAKIDPSHKGVKLEIANDLHALGRFVEAEHQLICILDDDPTNAGAMWALASHLIAFERLDEAFALCNQAVGQQPQSVTLHLLLGLIARQKGDRKTAICHFQTARDIDPNSQAILEISTEFRELGQFDKAHAVLDPVIQDSPLALGALLQRGRIFRMQCLHQAAAEIFQTALAVDPHSVQAKVELAIEHRSLGQPHASFELLQAALAVEPRHFGVLEQINEHFWIADAIEQSLELCVKWIGEYPHHPTPIARASRALFELGRADEAFDMLETATKRLGRRPELLATKIDGYRRLSNWKAVVEILEDCDSDPTGNFLLWSKRVQTAIDCGMYSKAEAALADHSACTQHEISRVAMFRGQIAEARWQLEISSNHYNEALKVNAHDVGAHAELARIHLKLLNLDASRHHLGQQKQIQTAADVLRGNASNLSQTHIGQLLDEFSIDQQLLKTLREVRTLPSDQQVSRLKDINRNHPGHTPTAIMLVIALRQDGQLEFNRSIPADNSLGPHIPSRIVQYWDEAAPPEELLPLMQSWQTQHPDFEYVRFNDRTAQQFIRSHHPNGVFTAYLRARHPAQRADIFRLAYLSIHGGVYADADDRCLESVGRFIPNCTTFAAHQEDFGTLGNNFLAVAAGHPIVRRSLELATEALNRGDTDFLWLATGPGLLTRAFAQYVGDKPDRQWRASTAIFDIGELQRRVGIHCQVRYKRTKHWSKPRAQRRPAPSLESAKPEVLAVRWGTQGQRSPIEQSI